MYTTYTREQKHKWLLEWKKSELSAVAFSKDKVFSASGLRYWAKKENDKSTKGFVQIEPLTKSSTSLFAITYPNGVRLDVNQNLSITQIKSLIQ